MPNSLPPHPDLDQLRRRARDLRIAFQKGDPAASERIKAHHPRAHELFGNAPRPFRLSDAQLVIAREYGFSSWPKLKAHIDSLRVESGDPVELAKAALMQDDPGLLRKILQRHPELKARINDPHGAFDSPVLHFARSRGMLDVLLAAGADINAKSRWWAGGFGFLHTAAPDLASYAIERGAEVDVHAAARLGLIDRLKSLISSDPGLVNARGGDGQTPLHFAASIPVAEYLLEHGADIDARDVDHESTPAQYMVRDRPEVARYLVRRGCQTDLLMAAALGDIDLARRHLDANPDCIRLRVSEEYFPMLNGRAGGTIYQWTLGWHVSAHQVARQFGHDELFDFLMQRSPPDVRLLAACWCGDERTALALVEEHPGLVSRLSAGDLRQPAHAARNNDFPALRAMLLAGLPIDARGQHNATPLHWAAWHGNAPMVEWILARNPPLEDAVNDFRGTPLRWAIHGSQNGWHRDTGDYPRTVRALLEAGARLPDAPDGADAVREVIDEFQRRRSSANGPRA